MGFTVDETSSVPAFEQLRAQVIDGIRNGTLVAGARLPTVRGLAEELELAPNTIAKAYRTLEADEVIETRGRAGTFVAPHGGAIERQAQLAAAAYALRIRQLGLDSASALALVEAALRGS